jgi:hypothetical protein
MICEDARRLIGAEPSATSGELAQHLKDCHACAEFQLEMVALDANIRRALEAPPALPVGVDGRPPRSADGPLLPA